MIVAYIAQLVTDWIKRRLARHRPEEVSALPKEDHWHCLHGCDHACAELIDGEWVCASCRGPWVECTPEVCPEFNREAAA